MVFWIAAFPPNWNTSSRRGGDTSFQATDHTLENKIFKFLKVSYPSTLKGVNTLGRVCGGQLWPVRLLREVQLWSCSTASGLHVCNDSPEVCHITHNDTCCVCYVSGPQRACGSQETNSTLFWGKFSFVYCCIWQASWPSNFYGIFCLCFPLAGWTLTSQTCTTVSHACVLTALLNGPSP